MMQQLNEQLNEKQRIQELEKLIVKLGFILTSAIKDRSIIDKMIEMKLNISREELDKRYAELAFRCTIFIIGDN